MSAGAETMQFRTELKQLLHLITHSLYSNREIFLRELISNASDAINKIRFDSLDNEQALEDNRDWKIRLTADKENNTLTISDNGIGMSRETIIDNLGTIARSGTKAFLDQLKAKEIQTRPDLIGQFGVGFYSAFMVADKVTVLTRMAGSPSSGIRWESDGQGEFSIEDAEKATRGTDVILHLKEDAKEYLDSWSLRSLVKKFSDFLEFPVVMDVENEAEDGTKTTTEETLNSQKALWLRHKNEVTPEEYNAFYEQITNDETPPAKVIHYLAEGSNEFRVLVFIPAKKPMSFDWEEPKGVRLYIQRVLIMDSCEGLLPPYLRFVRGVVDSSDLPLNISRELLQNNPLLDKIQKNLVRNILDGLEGMKNVEEEKYAAFFREFGYFIKQGMSQDWTHREKLTDLVMFESMNTEKGKLISFGQYLEKMPAEQQEILYLTGESREVVEHSPLLESFRSKGFDVLFLIDTVDEFITPSLREYKGKKFRAVDRGDLEEAEKTETPEAFAGLFTYLKSKLPEVSDIRLSKRLTESASCLVADTSGVSANYERIMQKMGRESVEAKRILELNTEHPTLLALRDLYASNPEDARIEIFGRLLYDQAVIAEGSRIKDPSAMARRINDLILRDAGVKTD